MPEPAQERGQFVADVGLAPAGEADLEDLAVRLVGGRPGRRQPPSSSSSLIARSIGSAVVIDTYDVSGSCPCSPSRCIAQAESESA